MEQPVLTPCCDQRVRWDGEMWYCGSCSRKFMPERPDFEKPFPKKNETADRVEQPSYWKTSVVHYAYYLAMVVPVF
jgi:hypothetical protein